MVNDSYKLQAKHVGLAKFRRLRLHFSTLALKYLKRWRILTCWSWRLKWGL